MSGISTFGSQQTVKNFQESQGVDTSSIAYNPIGSPIGENENQLKDILALIDSYKDDEYIYTQLMNVYNSYTGQKFAPNIFQQIGQAVGDYSAQQNFANQQLAGLRADIGRIIEGAHKESYTSEPAQLERLKAAGINVDLNGGQALSAGEPASIDQPEVNQSVLNDGSEVVTPLFQAGAQIVSFAMQAYQGFMNVKSLNLDNMIKEFSLSSSARDLAWNVIGEGVTEFMTSPSFDESLKDDPSSVALIPSLVRSFGARINSLPLSRKQRKYMHSVIDDLVYSFDNDGSKVPTAKYQTLVNDTLKKLYGSRADAVQEYGRIGAEIEDIAVQRVISHDIYRPLNEMAIELQNDMNHLNKLMVQFDTSYYTEANKLGVPSMSAKADFVSRKMQYEIKKTQTKITNTFNAIDRKLEYNKKIGPNWKMALQTALAVGESWVINTAMSSLKSFNFSPHFSFSSNHDNFSPSY